MSPGRSVDELPAHARSTRLGPGWQIPPSRSVLERDDIHVWLAALAPSEPSIAAWQGLLSTDEQARAERFTFADHRRRFVFARAVLRLILARYTTIEPARLEFVYGPHGKPRLADKQNGTDLQFSVSHSDELALYGVTRGRRIGVDLERVRPDLGHDEIKQMAERFFSPREAATILAAPPQQRRETFLRCWTRKEAYVKATGKGLSLPLDQFDVSMDSEDQAALLRTDWDPEEAGRWTIAPPNSVPGHVAALAAEGQSWQLQCWQWPEDHPQQFHTTAQCASP